MSRASTRSLFCWTLCVYSGSALKTIAPEGAEAALVKKAVSKNADCTCLNWDHAYTDLGGICGEGLEFTAELGGTTLPTLEDISAVKKSVVRETCKDFYLKLHNNMCSRPEPGPPDASDWHAGTWCYVDTSCEHNGTFRVPDKLVPRPFRIKECQHGVDSLLGDMAPEELFDFATNHSLGMAYFVGMAYPTIPKFLASEMEDAWAWGDVWKLPDVLQHAIEHKLPVVVNVQPDGRGDKKVIYGHTSYRVAYQMQKNEEGMLIGGRCSGKKGCLEKEQCEMGCKKVQKEQ